MLERHLPFLGAQEEADLPADHLVRRGAAEFGEALVREKVAPLTVARGDQGRQRVDHLAQELARLDQGRDVAPGTAIAGEAAVRVEDRLGADREVAQPAGAVVTREAEVDHRPPRGEVGHMRRPGFVADAVEPLLDRHPADEPRCRLAGALLDAGREIGEAKLLVELPEPVRGHLGEVAEPGAGIVEFAARDSAVRHAQEQDRRAADQAHQPALAPDARVVRLPAASQRHLARQACAGYVQLLAPRRQGGRMRPGRVAGGHRGGVEPPEADRGRIGPAHPSRFQVEQQRRLARQVEAAELGQGDDGDILGGACVLARHGRRHAGPRIATPRTALPAGRTSAAPHLGRFPLRVLVKTIPLLLRKLSLTVD